MTTTMSRSTVRTTQLLRQFILAPSHCPRRISPGNRIHAPPSRSTSYFSDRILARRSFSSSQFRLAVSSSHPPGEPSQLLSYPSPNTLETSEDPDDDPVVELVPPEEATIQMTERAAEQLRSIAERQKNPEAALRIAVESGGCHGYQYKMELATSTQSDDYLFSHPSVKPSNIVIDAVSMSLVKGSIVDFATELIGSSFRILDNPQSKGSGCGCGVSWELKE